MRTDNSLKVASLIDSSEAKDHIYHIITQFLTKTPETLDKRFRFLFKAQRVQCVSTVLRNKMCLYTLQISLPGRTLLRATAD